MPLEEVYRRRIVPGFVQGTPQASILPRIGGGFYNGGYWSFSTIVCADGSYYMPDLLLNRGWCWKGDPPTASLFPGDSGNNGSAGGHASPKNPTATKWSAQLDTAQFVDGGWQQNKNMFVNWYNNNCGGYTPDQNPAKVSYTITSVLKFLKWNTSSRAFDTLKTVTNVATGDGVGNNNSSNTTYDASDPLRYFNALSLSCSVAQPLYYSLVGDGYYSVDSVPSGGGLCNWDSFATVVLLTGPSSIHP